MGARYLLDTSICIYIRREHPPQILKRVENLKVGEAALSVITYGELFHGVEKSQQRTRAMRQSDEPSKLLPILPVPKMLDVAMVKSAPRWKRPARSSAITTSGSPRTPRLPIWFQ